MRCCSIAIAALDMSRDASAAHGLWELAHQHPPPPGLADATDDCLLLAGRIFGRNAALKYVALHLSMPMEIHASRAMSLLESRELSEAGA